MTAFINVMLLLANIIFFVLIMLFAILGIYDQIMGPDDTKKLLKKLKIPLSYNQILIIELVCIVLLFVTYILQAKLSGKL